MTNRKNLAELSFTEIKDTAMLVGGAGPKETGRKRAKHIGTWSTHLTAKLESGTGNEDKIKERLAKLDAEIEADPIDGEGPIATK